MFVWSEGFPSFVPPCGVHSFERIFKCVDVVLSMCVEGVVELFLHPFAVTGRTSTCDISFPNEASSLASINRFTTNGDHEQNRSPSFESLQLATLSCLHVFVSTHVFVISSTLETYALFETRIGCEELPTTVFQQTVFSCREARVTRCHKQFSTTFSAELSNRRISTEDQLAHFAGHSQ